jgi:hypothetical protein
VARSHFTVIVIQPRIGFGIGVVTNTEVNRGADIIPLPLKEGGTQAAILGLVKNRVDRKLEYLLSGLKINIADALFEEMTSLNEQEIMASHFNIMRETKVAEQVYTEAFNEAAERIWLSFLKGFDDSHLELPIGAVSDDMKQMSRHVYNHYKVLIKETRYRFQTLLKREITDNPLMPELYYRMFWQSLAELDLSYREKRYVLKLFHRFVMDRYGQILAAANNTLIEMRVDLTVEVQSAT